MGGKCDEALDLHLYCLVGKEEEKEGGGERKAFIINNPDGSKQERVTNSGNEEREKFIKDFSEMD